MTYKLYLGILIVMVALTIGQVGLYKFASCPAYKDLEIGVFRTMGLLDIFKPKWKHSKVSVRCHAVEMLEKPHLLAVVACDDPSPKVRKIAVAKLVDQGLLEDIAESDESHEVGLVALSSITHQQSLLRIASNAKNAGVSVAALDRLKQDEHLYIVAKQTKHFVSSSSAVSRISDKKYLYELLGERIDAKLRKLIQNRLESM